MSDALSVSTRESLYRAEASTRPTAARILAAPLEALFSDRGLGLIVLILAGVLVAGGWIRPPLSSDIRALYVPLGAWEVKDAAAPEELLAGLRVVPADSLGLILYGIIVGGAVAVLWQPRLTGAVCGLLLAASICGNVVLVNHPRLVELMDLEYTQRWQMVGVVSRTPVKSPLASPVNGRVIGESGTYRHDQLPGDLMRSLVYLNSGRWLVALAAFGCLMGTRGGFKRRVIALLVWSVVGLGAAGITFARRLYAEAHWTQSIHQESLGEYDHSRQSLDKALAASPELERLERTWLLLGKLDQSQGRVTSQRQFYLAYQLNRDQQRPTGMTAEEDIEWDPFGVADYRQELRPTMTGPYLDISPSVAGAHGYHVGLSNPMGEGARTYPRNHARQKRKALDMMELLHAARGDKEPAVRQQAARFWTDQGLSDYPGPSYFADSGGFVFSRQQRFLGGTQVKWQRALQIDPFKHDCAFYLGLSRGRVDFSRPEMAMLEFDRLKTRFADRILRAELLDSLGDAYFEAGHMAEAFRLYAESMDSFSLPKLINYRGQKALGGL